jgi:hypothetical protein
LDDYAELPDIRSHPQAENLVYRIEDKKIFFEYDINILDPRGLPAPYTWIYLYDSQGKIINVLGSSPTYCNVVFCFTSRQYHVYGVGVSNPASLTPWETPEAITNWWRPYAELTADDLRLVDRIKVFTEIQDESVCNQELTN